MKSKNRIWTVGVVALTLALLLVAASEAGGQVQMFKAPQAFPAGPNPVAEAAGDFNGDGKMDVAVANNSAGTVSVMLGNGDGTFQAPKNFAVGNGPVAIVATDFNGDGKLDLAVANSTDGTVSILLGNGDGTFQAAVNYSGAGGVWIVVGDLNGDGKLDLAVNDGGNIHVLIGNGDGTFQPPVNYQSGFYRTGPCGAGFIDLSSGAVVVGDLNGDGKPDLLVSADVYARPCYINQQGGCVCGSAYHERFFELFYGNGDGTFQDRVDEDTVPEANFVRASALVVGDFNGDGKLDLAASIGNAVSVYLGDGSGGLQLSGTYGTAQGAGTLTIGDLNGDGKLDLAVTNAAGGVSVLLGNGDGTFQTALNYVAGPGLSGIAIGDLNGDGKADIVVTNDIAVANNLANGAITVLLGNGDGTFGPEAPELQLGGALPLSLAAGDFNGDGKLDFAVADSTGVNSGSPGCSVVLGNGDGTFQTADFIPVTQGNPVGVATADLNGDGKLDFAVADGGTGVLVFLGNGDGTFQPAVGYSTPDIGSYPGVAIDDLNGDNKPDLAVTDGNGHVDILLGNGDGTFQAGVSYPSGQACTFGSVVICQASLAMGDFNGDGMLDLAVPDVTANTVNILLGNGNGSFQTPVTYPAGTQPVAVAIADLNGDGKLDLAVANEDGTVSVLLGKGDGTFQSAVSYRVVTAGAIMVGDFNGDGILDVVVQGSGMASVLLGKGDGTFQPQLNYAFGDAQFASGIATGDFDGDYTTDLVLGGGLEPINGGSTASVLLNVAGFYLYLTESGTGNGMVASTPSGMNCSSTCSASFAGGSAVTLTATPNSTSNFTGWSGACSGTGACSVTMKAATSVTATFALQDFSVSAASATLSVPVGGHSTDVITLTGMNGPFTNAIQLTCTVSTGPVQPTCALSPTSVTPGANSVTSTLTIAAPTTAAMQTPAGAFHVARSFYALWLPLMSGVLLLGRSRKQRRYGLLSGFLLLLCLLPACGNSNSHTAPPPTNYMVTVTGASGAVQHTAQVAVTVQ